jgi:predicted ATPase/DNA-binding SARP family transcriptional activator
MQFRLLGPLQVHGDRGPVSLGQPKQRLLLASLLLRRGRFASRDELIEALWGEQPPESAVGSLHVYVHGLRRLLGAERIEGRGTAYRIRLEPGELDLERFEALVEQARQALDGQPERAATALKGALALWQGPALGDLPSERLMPERTHLEELRVSALELLIEARLARGEHEQVIGPLAQAIAEHPYRERLREHQVLALYRSGRQKDALEAYRRAREMLVDELGIEPGPRLRALETAILRQEPELAAPAVASGARGDAPRGETSLPAPPTRLIGRERELGEIVALFREDGARLVTLTGPGGTGKTRLALASAEQLAPTLPDGARFIDLSTTPDPTLLLPTIVGQLDVPDGAPPFDSLAEYLRGQSILLVLDKLERLVEAATALSDLLRATPGLLILVTSRVRLNLRAEHEYPVPPLALPEAGARFDAIASSEAVQLLVERARAVNRTLALTESSAAAFARICRRLDGLPLALELAASRLRSLTPDALAAGLDRALDVLVEGPRDLPDRQRTLRAMLEWSHVQLGADEQRLFAQLGAFAGPFHADDVRAVCGPDSREPLASLVEANLVRRQDAEAFTMFETIREYAVERLEHDGAADLVRDRHSRHFLALAERAHQAILAAEESAAAFRSLERAHDNLREALTWTEQAGQVELEVRLACALRQFWIVRGHLAEGRAFFERAVAATEDGDPRLRAQALMHGGPFLYRQGQLAQARAWWEEALALLTDQGDVAGASRCAGELGAVAFSEGDFDRAALLFARAAEGFESLGDRMRLGIVRANQAEVAALQGELPQATAYADEAVAIARDLGDADSLALGLHTLARLVSRAGQTERARSLFAECLSQARELGYREVLANCVQAAAELMLLAGGSPESAARLQAVARHALEQMGALLQGLEAQSFDRVAGTLAARLAPEQLQEISDQAAGVPLDAVLDAALAELEPRSGRGSGRRHRVTMPPSSS